MIWSRIRRDAAHAVEHTMGESVTGVQTYEQ